MSSDDYFLLMQELKVRLANNLESLAQNPGEGTYQRGWDSGYRTAAADVLALISRLEE